MHYTENTSAQLTQTSLYSISEDINARILWFSSIPYHETAEHISHSSHCHSFYEVHFVINGTMEFETDTKETTCLTAGEGVVFSPYTKHSVKELDSETIRFSFSFQLENSDTLHKLLTSQKFFCFSVNSRMLDCINIILYENRQTSSFSSLLIQNRLFEVLCELIRTLGINEYFKDSDPKDTGNFVIQKAQQYIADNQDKLLCCNEVADYCHYNARYLSRLFVRHTGVTLLKYIHDEKMKYAEELLKEDALTLNQISNKLGFANVFYFNRFFKRNGGISPGRYRQLHNNFELEKTNKQPCK